jgi:hypothetical protein
VSPAAKRALEEQDDYERGRRNARLDLAVLGRGLVVSIHARGAYGEGYRRGLSEGAYTGD